MEALSGLLAPFGQEHVLKFYQGLSEEQKRQLETQVQSIDWSQIDKLYKEQVLPRLTAENKLKLAAKIDDSLLEPLAANTVEGTASCPQALSEQYRETGLKYVSQGKVAALLLAGGQGTRLGFNKPKGMYDVGLPSRKSLFQLQAGRILQVIRQASELYSVSSASINWYIMTSEATMTATQEYFRANNFFGLDAGRVIFFEQASLPCLSFDGKVLLDSPGKVAMSPNGNGGLYEALHRNDILKHLTSEGVEFLHVYCVDNILVRVCDPTFVGYCITKQVDAGAKVVQKVEPNEAVGTICRVDGTIKVIEYSEISDRIANKRDPSSQKLSFSAGNICDHFFRVHFLCSIRDDMGKVLPYHLAIKKIPHVDLTTGQQARPKEPNGIKLERFIFDVFEFSERFVAWEVRREDEFSPIKNATGAQRDTPETARAALLRCYELGQLTDS